MYRCEDPQQFSFTTWSALATAQIASIWPDVNCKKIGWYGDITFTFKKSPRCPQQPKQGQFYAMKITDGCLEYLYIADCYIPHHSRFNPEATPVPEHRWREIYDRRWPTIYANGGNPNYAVDHFYTDHPESDDREYYEGLEPMTYTPSNSTPRSQRSVSDHEDQQATEYAERWFVEHVEAHGGRFDYSDEEYDAMNIEDTNTAC